MSEAERVKKEPCTWYVWMTAGPRGAGGRWRRSSERFDEKHSVPWPKWLYAKGRFPLSQVPASVSVVSFSYLFNTFTHTGALTHTHTHTHTHTLRALAAPTQSPCPAKHLVQNVKGLDGFSAKFFKLCWQKVWPSKPLLPPTPPPPLRHRAAVVAPPSDTPCRSWSAWRRGAGDSAETGSGPRLGRSKGKWNSGERFGGWQKLSGQITTFCAWQNNSWAEKMELWEKDVHCCCAPQQLDWYNLAGSQWLTDSITSLWYGGKFETFKQKDSCCNFFIISIN